MHQEIMPWPNAKTSVEPGQYQTRVVEWTFALLAQNKRISNDYERLPETGEAFDYATMTRLMARRLARS